MKKVKHPATPTHAVGEAHPVETQGVTNSSHQLMNEPSMETHHCLATNNNNKMDKKQSPALHEEQQQPTAATAINPTDLDSNDQPSATGCVAQPIAELPTATPDADAGSQSKCKTEVVEETNKPEEFRKAAIETYLEDFFNEISSFSYEDVRVLLIEESHVIYQMTVKVPLKDVLLLSEELYGLKDCYVGEDEPKVLLLANGTVVYEGATFRCKWSEEKTKKALDCFTKMSN